MSFLLKLVDANGVELYVSIEESVRAMAGATKFDVEHMRYLGIFDQASGNDACGVTLASEQEIIKFLSDPNNDRAIRDFRAATRPQDNFKKER